MLVENQSTDVMTGVDFIDYCLFLNQRYLMLHGKYIYSFLAVLNNFAHSFYCDYELSGFSKL